MYLWTWPCSLHSCNSERPLFLARRLYSRRRRAYNRPPNPAWSLVTVHNVHFVHWIHCSTVQWLYTLNIVQAPTSTLVSCHLRLASSLSHVIWAVCHLRLSSSPVLCHIGLNYSILHMFNPKIVFNTLFPLPTSILVTAMWLFCANGGCEENGHRSGSRAFSLHLVGPWFDFVSFGFNFILWVFLFTSSRGSLFDLCLDQISNSPYICIWQKAACCPEIDCNWLKMNWETSPEISFHSSALCISARFS